MFSPLFWSHPGIIEVEDEDILRADAHELIHHVRHLGPLDHGADRDPLGVLERADCRRASARRDGRRGGERRAAHIVLANDVFSRSDDASDAGCDLVDERREVGVLRRRGPNQDRLGLQQRRDRPEARRAHRLAGFYKVDDAICEAECARGLDTAADILDLGTGIVALDAGALVDVREEMAREDLEARDDALSRERIDAIHGRGFGHLHLQRALAKAEAQRLRDVGLHLRLEDDVVARDAEVDVALADERGDVRRGQEDERDGVVLYEADVETVRPTELDIRSSKQCQAFFVKTTCESAVSAWKDEKAHLVS